LSAAAISILLAAPEDTNLLIDNMLSDSSDDDNDAFDENFIDDKILHDHQSSQFSSIYISL
jgi:hypothetical protein